MVHFVSLYTVQLSHESESTFLVVDSSREREKRKNIAEFRLETEQVFRSYNSHSTYRNYSQSNIWCGVGSMVKSRLRPMGGSTVSWRTPCFTESYLELWNAPVLVVGFHGRLSTEWRVVLKGISTGTNGYAAHIRLFNFKRFFSLRLGLRQLTEFGFFCFARTSDERVEQRVCSR